jgi:hypothetical protein
MADVLSFPVNLLTPAICTKDALFQICKNHSQDITGDFIANKWAFLWALCGKESSFGAENFPKFEPVFGPDGLYFEKSKQLKMLYYDGGFGAFVSMSYSPWQILYATAFERGFSQHPCLLHSPSISAPYVVMQLNYLIKCGANTLELLFASWNAGPGVIKNQKLFPTRYVQDSMMLYDKAISICV